MKFLTLIALFLFSLAAYACPDLTGTYVNPDDDTIVLKQVACNELTVQSQQINQKLVLNNQYVVVQDNEDLEAQGRGIFIGDVLTIEVKIKYKNEPPLPRMFTPVRALIKYTKLADGNLTETTFVYNDTNGVITSDKVLYKKR